MAEGAATVVRDVVCPFCGLACDDLAIERSGADLFVVKNGCPTSEAAFGHPLIADHPRVHGKPVDLAEACRAAAAILGKARLPLLAGLGVDVDGMRAALRLAERCGAVVDQMGSAGLMANVLAMQSAGRIDATLAEVRNRADLIVFIGTDAGAYPRFFERVVRPPQALVAEALAQRRLVFIGDGLAGPDDGQATTIPCAPEHLAEMVGVLRALLGGARLQTSEVAGTSLSVLQDLVDAMRAASYGVVVWEAGRLGAPHADLLVEAIAGLVRTLNTKTRFAGLPLGGNDNAIGVNQVCAWQTGFAVRTRMLPDGPDYDPHRFGAQTLLETGAADALVWISAFRDVPPPRTEAPTVVMGMPGMNLTAEPDVFIPVGTPGVDHAGTFFRMDSVVALPLGQLRESAHPSAATALDAIAADLTAETDRPC